MPRNFEYKPCTVRLNGVLAVLAESDEIGDLEDIWFSN
jgi:hypothetical protein